MKTTLKWVTVAVLVALGMAGPVQATQINYYLLVDSTGPGTWSLSASTDAPNGISAFVVNLDNVVTGTSVAPRATSPNFGFTSGNVLVNPAGGGKQAFAYQPNSADSNPGSIVYNIGASSVPNTAFGPGAMTGSASVDANAFVGGLQVELFKGTYTVGTRIGFSAAGAPIGGSVNQPVVGPAGGVMTQQPINAGSIYTAGAPSELTALPTSFTYTTIFPGDVNGDFFVNQLDLNVMSSHWQASGATLADGDANGDGFVNQLDLNVVSSHWQAASPAVGAVAAVPEPGSLILLAIGVVGLVSYGRRFA